MSCKIARNGWLPDLPVTAIIAPVIAGQFASFSD
jgi:hypothetical protein